MVNPFLCRDGFFVLVIRLMIIFLRGSCYEKFATVNGYARQS